MSAEVWNAVLGAADRAGLVAVLIVIVVTAFRGNWVPGAFYTRELERANRAELRLVEALGFTERQQGLLEFLKEQAETHHEELRRLQTEVRDLPHRIHPSAPQQGRRG